MCKKSHGIPSSPRAAAVAKFRLLTGHDCLCAHLFRFNLVTSPICVLCDTGQDMTATHLDKCSALNDLNCIVKRFWGDKKQFKDMESKRKEISVSERKITVKMWKVSKSRRDVVRSVGQQYSSIQRVIYYSKFTRVYTHPNLVQVVHLNSQLEKNEA
ncbi:uncharacterized protein TNCV_3553241 [Trichonephila clavipes]|nr:uncharacterized protein TNCV_3553241 [Trichonephila clavipes]